MGVDGFLGPRQLTGLLLVVGAGLFLVGASNPRLYRVWTAPDDLALRLIDAHRAAWRWTNALFAVATVLTAAGLWLLVDLVGSDVAPLARGAAVAYLLAAGAWLASLVFRLAVTPAAATSFVATATLDPSYVALGRWSGGLFAAFTIVAGGSLVALGGAILLGGAVLAAVGWFALAIGLVVMGGFLATGDMPPFVAYLPTGLIGLALLLVPS